MNPFMRRASIPVFVALLPLGTVAAQSSVPTPIPNYSTVVRDQVSEAYLISQLSFTRTTPSL